MSKPLIKSPTLVGEVVIPKDLVDNCLITTNTWIDSEGNHHIEVRSFPDKEEVQK